MWAGLLNHWRRLFGRGMGGWGGNGRRHQTWNHLKNFVFSLVFDIHPPRLQIDVKILFSSFFVCFLVFRGAKWRSAKKKRRGKLSSSLWHHLLSHIWRWRKQLSRLLSSCKTEQKSALKSHQNSLKFDHSRSIYRRHFSQQGSFEIKV